MRHIVNGCLTATSQYSTALTVTLVAYNWLRVLLTG